jgi:hypothetical protein
MSDGRVIPAVVREHRLFLLLCATYLGVGVLFDLTGIVPGLVRKLSYVYAYALAPALMWLPLLGTLIRERFRLRVDGRPVNDLSAWGMAYRQARKDSLSSERIAGLLLVCLLVPVFMNTFGGWKSAIPVLHPFSYDDALVKWDRALHGEDPWRLLHPALGRPSLTWALDQLYSDWLLLVPIAILWQGWSRHRALRAQFFVAFALMWIVLGTVLATTWSSAGPCYYARVTSRPDPYAPLLGYLGEVHTHYRPLFSRITQDLLWANYMSPSAHPYTRISAMPSLHVAMPALCTLAAWRTHRGLALVIAGYTVAIFLASIHLGWHYALDGEVSLVLVPIIWWAAGVWVRRERWHPSHAGLNDGSATPG